MAEASRLLDYLDPGEIERGPAGPGGQRVGGAGPDALPARFLPLRRLRPGPGDLSEPVGRGRPSPRRRGHGAGRQATRRCGSHRGYASLGISEFILSGYPHLEEAYWFGRGCACPNCAGAGLSTREALPPGHGRRAAGGRRRMIVPAPRSSRVQSPGEAVRCVALVGHPKPESRTRTVAVAAATAVLEAAGTGQRLSSHRPVRAGPAPALPEPSPPSKTPSRRSPAPTWSWWSAPPSRARTTGLLKVFLDRLPHRAAGRAIAAACPGHGRTVSTPSPLRCTCGRSWWNWAARYPRRGWPFSNHNWAPWTRCCVRGRTGGPRTGNPGRSRAGSSSRWLSGRWLQWPAIDLGGLLADPVFWYRPAGTSARPPGGGPSSSSRVAEVVHGPGVPGRGGLPVPLLGVAHPSHPVQQATKVYMAAVSPVAAACW